jgi:hypothetical protein
MDEINSTLAHGQILLPSTKHVTPSKGADI